MYLKQAFIENSGSIRSLNLTLDFTDQGLPKPLILVGGNGGGKTNFLSTVADALFEAAAVHYTNLLTFAGQGRNWFRVVGGPSVSLGATGSVSLLRFDDAGEQRFFKEKSGILNAEDMKKRISQDFSNQVSWLSSGNENIKEFSVNDARSEKIFSDGAYVYFPSSRSEVPYWLNQDALPEQATSSEVMFDTARRVAKKLRKPLYVEHPLGQFKQWLIGLLADARASIAIKFQDEKRIGWELQGYYGEALYSSTVLDKCNKILQEIWGNEKASFLWLGRKSPDKVSVAVNGQLAIPNLDALSSGQAILLGMFGTLLRYGDISGQSPELNLETIEGVCIIDEIDAHIHIELQNKVLPKLIKLFPKVQFILSSHSPLFVVGMEREFGPDNIQIVEMPTGTPLHAEAYEEFAQALEVLASTKAFTNKVVAEAKNVGKPIVYVEGETDGPYLRKAAELHGKLDLLEKCDIEWIGAKDEGGQGFHTGKDALKHTLAVLKANPLLSNRDILLLYDNDANVKDQDYDGVSVRMLPKNPNNKKVGAGIENLLSEDCLGEEFYETTKKFKQNGDEITTRTLRKQKLCDHMKEGGTLEQFSAFAGALAIIEEYLSKIETSV